jgi:hypothetical protein
MGFVGVAVGRHRLNRARAAYISLQPHFARGVMAPILLASISRCLQNNSITFAAGGGRSQNDVLAWIMCVLSLTL